MNDDDGYKERKRAMGDDLFFFTQNQLYETNVWRQMKQKKKKKDVVTFIKINTSDNNNFMTAYATLAKLL